MNAAQWVWTAREALVKLLEQEYAVVWPEVEAKLADRPWPGIGVAIHPHHLTTARQQLRAEGVIVEETAVTRGGRKINILCLADTKGRSRAVKDASARKRLLQARYLRWAEGENYLGRAGEAAVHSTLTGLAPIVGYRLERPEGGEVGSLFGAPIPGGALDNVAHLQITDPNGAPGGAATLAIEVKNVRGWIYPDSPRLHQLLFKAAKLSQMFPDYPLLPVLVCRRAAYTTFLMAGAVGFYVAQTKVQFVPVLEEVKAGQVEELRAELGYEDMMQTGPYRLLRSHFRKSTTIPGQAAAFAEKWAEIGATALASYERLKNPNLPRGERLEEAHALEAEARRIRREQRGNGDGPQEEDEWTNYDPD